MDLDRHLDWEGCFNVRDLGGLPTADGGRIRRSALVRADSVEALTEAGWAALAAHGVRTVVDLRNDDEVGKDVSARPPGITTVRLLRRAGTTAPEAVLATLAALDLDALGLVAADVSALRNRLVEPAPGDDDGAHGA